MKNFKLILPLIAIGFMLVGCKPAAPKQEPISEIKAFEEKAQQILPNAANPGDVALLFEMSGATFMPKLMNDPLAYEKYMDKPLFAAANVGIYMADGLYQYIYKENAGAYRSFMAAKSLTVPIGLESIFDQIVIKRLEEGLTPKDSLIEKFSVALNQSSVDFTDNEKYRIYTSLISGNYIEKLYLVMSTVFDYPVDLPQEPKLLVLREMIVVMGGQLKSLSSLLELIEKYETVNDPGVVSNELRIMKGYLSQIDIQQIKEHATPDDIFKNENLLKLHESVIRTRTFLVNGQVEAAK